jgi:hypothetical protein
VQKINRNFIIGGYMNERYKIIIVILGILLAVSIGFNIHYGRPAQPGRTGEQLAAAIDEQGDYILISRESLEQLRSDINTATVAAESANRRVNELNGTAKFIYGIALGSVERSDIITRGNYSLIERQRLIVELYADHDKNYRRIEERLRDSFR